VGLKVGELRKEKKRYGLDNNLVIQLRVGRETKLEKNPGVKEKRPQPGGISHQHESESAGESETEKNSSLFSEPPVFSEGDGKHGGGEGPRGSSEPG